MKNPEFRVPLILSFSLSGVLILALVIISMMYFQERSAYDALDRISQAKSMVIESLNDATRKQGEILEKLETPTYTESELLKDASELQSTSLKVESSFKAYVETLKNDAELARVRTNAWINSSDGCLEFVNDGTKPNC